MTKKLPDCLQGREKKEKICTFFVDTFMHNLQGNLVVFQCKNLYFIANYINIEIMGLETGLKGKSIIRNIT